MGTTLIPSKQGSPGASGLAAALFSRTQQQVLGLLFGHPERSYYLSEIMAIARVGRSGIQREMARLVDSGLVQRRDIGNQHHFQANPACPIFGELCAIVRKTVGLAAPLSEALQPLRRQIRLAAIFGSVARGAESAASDIDLLLVSDALTLEAAMRVLQDAERTTGRRISPVIYGSDEFMRKRARKAPFLSKLLASDPVVLIGSLDVAASTRETRSDTAAQD